jgi:hypothetical protein
MTSALRRLALLCLTALFLSVPLAGPASADALSDAQQFTTLLNQARADAGLPALVSDVRLVTMATAWSTAMAAAGVLSHNPALTTEAPYGWTRLSENVGYGGTVAAVHNALMNSPGHRANILDPNVNAVGVGVAYSGGRVWVTEDFMKHDTLVPVITSVGTGPGYRLVGAAGGVFTFGSAATFATVTSASRVVGGASTPSGQGYWLVDEAGVVQGRGDAPALGGLQGRALAAPIVGMAATPSGRGYWLLGRDGGVFSFGDAAFYGSTGNIRLNQPVVGMASSPTGKGYWFVASDGGIFSYGDAPFAGSTGAIHLNQPIVGMASHSSGKGYWLVARDGGIFAFGNAPFAGSTGAISLNQPIVGMAATTTGKGYRFVAADGGVFSFGDASFRGSLGGATGGAPIVGMLAAA